MRGVLGIGAGDARAAAPRTSASPPTTSSSRSATTSGPATRPATGIDPELLRAVPAARGGAGGARRRASGRWSSSRPTTRWRRPRRSAAADPRVERVLICTPDKDLAQCVGGDARRAARPPQAHAARRGRRRREVRRAAGVDPRLPGAGRRQPPTATRACPGWGAKSAATVLARFGHLDRIPDDHRHWGVDVARAGMLAAVLAAIARRRCSFASWRCCASTLPVFDTVDDLAWHRGPTRRFGAVRASGRCVHQPQLSSPSGTRHWHRCCRNLGGCLQFGCPASAAGREECRS